MSNSVRDAVQASLARRHRRERLFRGAGLLSIVFGLLALLSLLVSIASDGVGAFQQSYVELSIEVDADMLDVSSESTAQDWDYANYTALIRQSLRERFPDMNSRSDKRALYRVISDGADFQLRNALGGLPVEFG